MPTLRRDSMALGEGAVVICLERPEFARRRNARVYARILGQQMLNEAAGPFAMDLSGHVTASVIRELLTAAGRAPREVDFFCGHGTATRYNDLAESRALASLYDGDLGRAEWPPVTSIKPIFGHLLGASGIVNAAATSLVVHYQRLVPTINRAEAVPECDHDHVWEGSRTTQVNLAVSLSFAIGSQTSAVAFGVVE